MLGDPRCEGGCRELHRGFAEDREPFDLERKRFAELGTPIPRKDSIAHRTDLDRRFDELLRARELTHQAQEVDAVDVLHREIRNAGDATELDDLNDLGMREVRAQLGVFDELRGALVITQPLQRDASIEPALTGNPNEEQLRCRPNGKNLEQLVSTQASNQTPLPR